MSPVNFSRTLTNSWNTANISPTDHIPLLIFFFLRVHIKKTIQYRKILLISYKDHVTNEEVRTNIQQAIGPNDDLLTIVKRRKLQCIVKSPVHQVKTILQGKVKGRRKRGRQWNRWEDDIGEWTDLEFSKSQRAVENREKWRKLVVKSSVVPQRPSRLRDRWWWCLFLRSVLTLVAVSQCAMGLRSCNQADLCCAA